MIATFVDNQCFHSEAWGKTRCESSVFYVETSAVSIYGEDPNHLYDGWNFPWQPSGLWRRCLWPTYFQVRTMMSQLHLFLLDCCFYWLYMSEGTNHQHIRPTVLSCVWWCHRVVGSASLREACNKVRGHFHYPCAALTTSVKPKWSINKLIPRLVVSSTFMLCGVYLHQTGSMATKTH